MHYLAKLEGEGGVGSADVLRAAREHTEGALAAGALSAEVYEDSETTGGLAVVSRWARRSELEEFLSWSVEHAHGSMVHGSLGEPRATHYPLAR